MKTCKNCGAQLSDTAKFCAECGSKLEEKKRFCSECGSQLQPSAKFCPECGTPADSGKVENKNSSNITTPSPQKNQKKLTGFEEIKEKGGIIVYDPESYPSIIDKILTEIYPDYKKEFQSVGGILQEALKIFKSEDTEWEKFGEPAKNVARYGYPEDDYDEGIYYHIHDKETLILKGEGNTFRILSEEDQKKYDNFWILNADIRKLQDKIKNLVVFGDETSIRARLFKDFKKLEVVRFYGYVEGIRKEAFWNCPLKFLGLPEDLEKIVEDSFKGAKFKYLILPVFTSLDNFEWQAHSFVDCKELRHVLISEYLYYSMDDEDLEDCFQGCDKLNTQNIWSVDENLKIKRLSEGSEDDIEYDTDDMEDEQENLNDLSINKKENMEKNLSYKRDENDKYGFVDEVGNWVIQPKFDDAGNFSEGFAKVMVDGKFGFIKTDGSYLVEPKFDDAYSFSKGLALVEQDGYWGFIKTDGTYLIEPKFDDAYEFSEGFAKVEQDGYCGFIKTDGSYLVEPKFDDANDFFEGFAKVEQDGYCGFIKTDGSYLVEPKFDDAGNFSEGFAKVELDGKYGFIKTDGTYLVEPKFDDAGDFSEGFAEVELDGKYGFIKTNGTYLVEPKFDSTYKFSKGFAEVVLDGQRGVISTDGIFLVDEDC